MPRLDPEIRRRARQLRKDQTPEEAALWARLRNRRLNGMKFYRQHPIGGYIVDFFYPQGNLVIEVDGGGHLEQQEYDARRTEELNALGFRVIRFNNLEVRHQLEAVLEVILETCQE